MAGCTEAASQRSPDEIKQFSFSFERQQTRSCFSIVRSLFFPKEDAHVPLVKEGQRKYSSSAGSDREGKGMGSHGCMHVANHEEKGFRRLQGTFDTEIYE